MPEHVVVSACIAAGYRYYGDWPELSREQKSKLVAHYLLCNAIESHKNDTLLRDMEKKQKKGAKK